MLLLLFSAIEALLNISVRQYFPGKNFVIRCYSKESLKNAAKIPTNLKSINNDRSSICLRFWSDVHKVFISDTF